MKKIKFCNLKIGKFFRFERKLYIKDNTLENDTGVHIYTGAIRLFVSKDLVTPVKVKIIVK